MNNGTTSPPPAPSFKQAAATASTRSALIGAIFLMATSAIGPGFLTQTATFTAQLGAAFAFAILVSIILDIAIQLNVWRVIGISGLRAQELGNKVAQKQIVFVQSNLFVLLLFFELLGRC